MEQIGSQSLESSGSSPEAFVLTLHPEEKNEEKHRSVFDREKKSSHRKDHGGQSSNILFPFNIKRGSMILYFIPPKVVYRKGKGIKLCVKKVSWPESGS